jgi:type VI secretion system secreted protein VgrG
MPEHDFFKLTIQGLSSTVHVVKMEGEEALSELYGFEVEFVSEDAAIDFDAVVGKPALLEMITNDDPRFVHGIVNRFEETGVGQKLTSYTASIVPAFWTFGLKTDCCIYQALTVPDVIKDVLESGGMSAGTDFDLQLNATYPKREYIVQYRESDLDFVRRLAEEVGIFFFFEHTEDGHKLVFADDPGAHADITGLVVLPFRAAETGMQSDSEQVSNLRYVRTLRTGKVMMQSFNFEKNKLALKTESVGDAETEHVDYDFDGRYHDESAGKALAKIRQEAYAARRRTLTGSSNCRQLTAGYKFGVSDHPRDEFNADYVVTRVEHRGEQPQAAGADAIGEDSGRKAYTNTFESIPATVPFRPLPVTERALVDGPQTAVVTGPAGEEIHCDSHGRVKVKFHWDRYGSSDDKSSCWVRVSQSHRIADLAIPRVGEEVIVGFLEGDPDQPMVIGRVYNGGAQAPYALPGDKTKSTFKTLSSPGGGGFNELRFEDAAGSEEVFFHAQKDWNIKVLNNRTQNIGVDSTDEIGRDQTMSVGRDRIRSVKRNEAVDITKDQLVKIGGDRTEAVTGNESVKIDGNRTHEVVGNDTETVGKDRTVSIGNKDTLSIGDAHETSVGGDQTTSVKGDYSLEVKGDASVEVKGDHEVSAKGKASLDAKKDVEIKSGKKIEIEGKDEISLKCGDASITMKKNGDIDIKGKKINIKGSGDVIVKGSKIAGN